MSDDVTLHLGDCLEYMRTMPDGCIDAVITDPPYGIRYESGHDGDLPRSIVGDETTELRDAIIRQFSDKPMAVFATWRCVPPLQPRTCLVWHKNAGGMGDLSLPWRPDFEVIWIYGYAWAGYRGPSVLKAETVPTWNSGPARRLHPHEKPVGLIRQLIAKLPPGVTVFDPFMGSGTTGVACVQTGRKFIGCEIDPGYFAIAEKRIRDAQMQLRLPMEAS